MQSYVLSTVIIAYATGSATGHLHWQLRNIKTVLLTVNMCTMRATLYKQDMRGYTRCLELALLAHLYPAMIEFHNDPVAVSAA